MSINKYWVAGMVSAVSLSLFLVPTLSFAQVTSEQAPSPYHWTQFDLGANSALEAGGNDTYSGIIRWLPEYQLSEKWSLGLDLGFTDFKYNDTTHAAVLEYAVFGEYRYQQWSLKAYVGVQSWTSGPNRTALMMGPQFEYHFEQPLMNHLNSIFVSYTPVFQTVTTVHEIALGIAVGL